MNNEKPLFVPLLKKYYELIKSGEQDCEIRPNDYRFWNVKNVYPLREILFSSGYGKQDRIVRCIRSTMISGNLAAEKIPRWHIDAVEEIYGKRERWLIAYV